MAQTRASGGKRDHHARRGSILILTAILLTVLMGITALAVDFGNLSDYRHRMQSAADAAAVAGAREIKRNSALSLGNLQTLAYHDASNNGFANGVNGIVVTVNHGPASGPYAGDPKYVEVLITRAVPTFFMGLFGRPTMNVGVRAVAGQGPPGTGCIYALDASSTGSGIITSGSSDPVVVNGVSVSGINVPGCDILVNNSGTSAFKIGTGWDVNANSITIVGQADLADPSRVNPTPEEGADPIEDPFDGIAAPAAGACMTQVVAGKVVDDFDFTTGTHTLDPGTYCGTFTARGDAVVNYNPGVYLITGSTAFVVKDNATVNSVGTGGNTFWITQMKPTNITANAHVNLTASTTGPYTGILIANTSNKPSVSNIFDAANMGISGIVYYPNQHIEWKGVGGSGTLLIADTIKFTGTSVFSSPAGGGGGVPSVPGKVSKAE